MCGIAGIVHFNNRPAESRYIQAMCEAIAHRGPDDDGIFVENSVGFGHRRLSIIDLSMAGHQPMFSSDGRYILIFNGEIYNFNELRLELESRGYQFRSKTDSEVVLYAYCEWGPEVVKRFNGMFAFAIYDRQDQSVFFARDRYGIKPLYMTFIGDTLLFASEVKAFLTFPEFKNSLDQEALIEYFTFQNFFTNKTLFKNVELLNPATYVQIDLSSKDSRKDTRYWDYDFQEVESEKDERVYTEELDYLLRQAVNRQLVGDVPVGSYLSGGMDSGAITAISAPQIHDMHTFTVGFDKHSASGLEMAFDERPKAEFMSYQFKTRHYEMVLKAGDMERCMSDLVWHLEEPRVGQSYPNYYAAHLASKFNKIVLAGTGGDELFGGYPWRYYRAVNNSNFDEYVDKYYQFWQRLIPNKDIWKVFAPIKQDVGHVWTKDIFRNVFKTHAEKMTRPEDYINHSLYFEARTFLHGLLVVEDKLSMAHGIESRVPFLDNDLIDFAMKLPVKYKLGNLSNVIRINENDSKKAQKYFQKTKDGKLLLRKAISNIIPDEISGGIKQGFSAPDENWFKGESIDFVKDRLLSRNSSIYNWMDFKEVTSLLDQHFSGQCNRRLLVWSLLYFDEWCKQFLSGKHV
ncbi:Asparagine synthetase [Candidatus Terasakiella magnetica]|uniref:asparagine synthase (glutamine-hydrolyzing) n=1 Tax=Candidatus Terasakiella magnetica TaxID=1867952 RepID=A0A1C3RG60_9PROT|nr:asparagine synthase (glutamine-hydrolyzing) [Candidatus Terasakiella magnetica]SCA56245.1 Asparagine synthetase [Candidatus Terasakiella magnetica]